MKQILELPYLRMNFILCPRMLDYRCIAGSCVGEETALAETPPVTMVLHQLQRFCSSLLSYSRD